MIYIAIFLAMALLRVTQVRNLAGFLFAGLFLFVAFRFEVGCDWSGYYLQYKWPTDVPGYFWSPLLDLHKDFGFDYVWLNVTVAILFFAGVFAFGRRQPDFAAFLILLFPFMIINLPMSGVRQAAAAGVLFFAYNAFLDRATIQFTILVLIASAFHSSAAVFLIFAPLITGGITRTRLILAALLVIPTLFALAGSGSLETASSRYVDTDVESAGGPYRVGILFISAIFYFVALRPYWVRSRQPGLMLADAGALAMGALILVLPLSTLIADRLGYYFIPIQAMILARTPFIGVGQRERLYVVGPYVVLLVIFTIYVLGSSIFDDCYTPYRTWMLGAPPSRLDFLKGL